MWVLGGRDGCGATLGMDVSFSTVLGIAHHTWGPFNKSEVFYSLSSRVVRSLPDKWNNLSVGGRSQSEVLTFHPTLACLVGLGDPRSPSSFVSQEVSPSLLCLRFPHLFSLDLPN